MTRMLLLAALLAAALPAAGCDDDSAGDECTESAAQQCESDYDSCVELLDTTADTYPADLQACYDGLCDCFADLGCSTEGLNC